MCPISLDVAGMMYSSFEHPAPCLELPLCLQAGTALTLLNLGCCPAMTDDGAQRLTSLTGLRALSLAGCVNLGDAGVSAAPSCGEPFPAVA